MGGLFSKKKSVAEHKGGDGGDRGIQKGKEKSEAVPSKNYEEKKEEELEIEQQTDALFEKFQAKIDQHAQARGQYFEDSQKAYKDGDGSRAKELSELGKAEGVKMEEARKEQSEALYELRNPKGSFKISNTEYKIDLHGQQVQYALEYAEQALEKAGKQKGNTLLLITGAGNHSKGGHSKVKHEVHSILKKRKLQFEVVNEGSVLITF